MVQYATQATKRRFGQASLPFDLLPTRTPNNIESLELEDPLGKSDHTVIRMRLSLQELASPDKYGRNLSEMDKIRPRDLGLRTQWEIDRGENFVDGQ